MKDNLIIKGVTKRFGDRTVLEEIDFTIGQGEIVGFLGPSGAGKTTMLKIITGQLRQTAGDVYLLGRETHQINRATYQQIGLVSDNSGIYERQTLYKNLQLFCDVMDADPEWMDELIDKVRLAEYKQVKAGKLSKGQRQRLILIRALLHDPKIVFLDEPTSGLDPGTTKDVHKLLLELREAGTSIFLTTHDMEEATKLCDRVALLYEGRIVAYGSPTELSLRNHRSKTFTIRLKDRKERVLADDRQSKELLAKLLVSDKIVSVHSNEPNLEKVFLAVTGRSLK